MGAAARRMAGHIEAVGSGEVGGVVYCQHSVAVGVLESPKKLSVLTYWAECFAHLVDSVHTRSYASRERRFGEVQNSTISI